MNLSIMVYFAVTVAAGTGIALARKEYYNQQLWKAKRWRTQLKRFTLREYPPIYWILATLDKHKMEKMDMEIYEAISYLRNITAIGSGGFVSADAIIEQLAEHRGFLSPIYVRMLRLLRQNQKEKAIEYFSEAVGTEISKDFVRLLIQWDEINPKELMETLLSHQKNIKEVRLTIQKRRDETISDLIYLPVVINVMLLFINFIYVGYFIDQKEMLTMLL